MDYSLNILKFYYFFMFYFLRLSLRNNWFEDKITFLSRRPSGIPNLNAESMIEIFVLYFPHVITINVRLGDLKK